MLGLIWIQTVWHSDGIPERFFFFFWKKFILKKSTDDKKKHAELPSMQRVKSLSKIVADDILNFYTQPHDRGGVLNFHFREDNLSKCQGILIKLDTCIDIKEICSGLLMVKFRQCLTELSARDMILAGHYSLTFLFIYYFLRK